MPTRKRGSHKTVRKHNRKPSRKRTIRRKSFRGSISGKIMPPLDVRSKSQLKEFVKRIEKGPVTFIMVWAPWCPHCHTMMPHFDAASKSSGRSVQSIKVQDNMLPLVNEALSQKVNKSAKPLNVEGFPSIIVVDKKGNAVTDVEPIRNTSVMTKIMTEAGPLAENAGINNTKETDAVTANSIMKNNIKNIAENKPLSINKNAQLLSNIGIEETGLAASNPPKNIDIGEDELIESIKPLSNNLKASPESLKKSPESLKESIAPSPLNTFSNNSSTPNIRTPSGNIKSEADEIISMASPLTPPNTASDIESDEQKMLGGSRKSNGGSLYSAMARTGYSLAPAAALLASAALVMKHRKKIKTRKHLKKSKRRKTYRHD